MTSRRRSRLLGVFGGAAVSAYVLDRVTKLLVERHLDSPVTVIPHVLDLRYTTNAGGAFGILGRAPWLFFGATIVVSAVIVVAAFRVDYLPTVLGLGLIFGGAMGNLTDRVIHGHVTDFVDLHVWPVFNLADSAIVVGAVVVALAGFRRRPA